MTSRGKLLELIKTTVLDLVKREERPPQEKLDELRAWMDRELNEETPIAELGWDSARMTWLLVRLEETLDIDTSTLSLYELFTVGDLLTQLESRIAGDA